MNEQQVPQKPMTPQQMIWEDYFTQVATVAARTTTAAAEARGITPAEAKQEADAIYPNLRAERDQRLKELRSRYGNG